ncbi:MAG: PEP-CTERM sorting domain-containing protein [Planctomycetes bacterium]|nr:PEP-CTERM sorting domain-containing protein [Planctomycetota bacterium]
MQPQTFMHWLRTTIAAFLTLLAASWAVAIGPSNQVVPNPAPGGTNTLSSVVGVVGLGVGRNTINANGSGTVIDSSVIGNRCWLCVLTADHNFPNANRIVFPNYTLDAVPPAAGVKTILSHQQVAPIGVGQNVDAAVALVSYGAPDAFFFGVPDKSLTTAVGVGNTLTEVGFGRGGTNVVDGMGNIIGINEGNRASAGTKRYQNNLLTEFIANFAAGNGYVYNAINYTFDAQGAANRIAGEGWGMRGDSGAPLFNNGVTFDPGGGLPLLASIDSIAGVKTFGPLNATNGAKNQAVDVFDYRANIVTACNTLLATVPEPTSLVLLALGLVWFAASPRRRHGL